jgi:hypothetical protein
MVAVLKIQMLRVKRVGHIKPVQKQSSHEKCWKLNYVFVFTDLFIPFCLAIDLAHIHLIL